MIRSRVSFEVGWMSSGPGAGSGAGLLAAPLELAGTSLVRVDPFAIAQPTYPILLMVT